MNDTTTTTDESYRVTADELRQFVEQVEQLQAEARDLKEAEKEVFEEAKGRGYSVPTLRKIIAARKQDPDDRAESEALFQMYREALGMV